MPARTGAEYLAGLRAQPREIWLDGRRIADVTAFPGLANGARSVAALYDMQHDAGLAAEMTYASPTSGAPVGLSFIVPETAADLARRRTMMSHWAHASYGMMGRTPDFLIVNPSLGAAIGAQLGGTFGEAVAVDEYTVKAPLVTDIFWGIPISEFDINDTTVRLDSKMAYETVGAEAIRLVPVGSGPFTIGDWDPNNRGEVHAVPDHWIEPPHIGKFVVIQVPEITSRMAMMETGDADISAIDFARLTELENAGLKFITTMSDKDTMTLSAIWPGNLWTDINAKTQAPLADGETTVAPWEDLPDSTHPSVYSQDYPWIGCPWGDRCQYEDTDNPPGMSDMEQARLVRWGLSHAIDRQAIVDVLQAGLGTPIYLELMGPKFPGWRPDRTVTASMIKIAHEKYDDSSILGPGTDWIEYGEYDNAAEPGYKWPWTIPTDKAEAERLLDLAGYPKGPDGVRFEISLNKYRCETGDVCLEQADAVAADWNSIGVRVTLLTEEYGGVVVPRMRDRTQAFPVVKNCSVETANYPFDWPPPPSDSTFSRPACRARR